MMSAKELIIKARMAEETANKLSENIVKLEERAKLAEEKRQEKGFEMKKIEREYEVSGQTDDVSQIQRSPLVRSTDVRSFRLQNQFLVGPNTESQLQSATVLIGYYDYLGTRPKNCHRPIIVTGR